jgi:hypothetical protein
MSNATTLLVWCRQDDTPGVEFRVENIMGTFNAEARPIGRTQILGIGAGPTVAAAIAAARAQMPAPAGCGDAADQGVAALALAEPRLPRWRSIGVFQSPTMAEGTRLDPHRGSTPASWRGPAAQGKGDRTGNKLAGRPVPDPMRSIDALIADAKAARAAAIGDGIKRAWRWWADRWLGLLVAGGIFAVLCAAAGEPLP